MISMKFANPKHTADRQTEININYNNKIISLKRHARMGCQQGYAEIVHFVFTFLMNQYKLNIYNVRQCFHN